MRTFATPTVMKNIAHFGRQREHDADTVMMIGRRCVHGVAVVVMVSPGSAQTGARIAVS